MACQQCNKIAHSFRKGERTNVPLPSPRQWETNAIRWYVDGTLYSTKTPADTLGVTVAGPSNPPASRYGRARQPPPPRGRGIARDGGFTFNISGA